MFCSLCHQYTFLQTNKKIRYKCSERIAACFIEHAHHQAFLHNIVSAEERQLVLNDAHERVATLECDMLQRTINVSDASGLDKPGALECLRLFLYE